MLKLHDLNNLRHKILYETMANWSGVTQEFWGGVLWRLTQIIHELDSYLVGVGVWVELEYGVL